jgi:hypothetical protein
MSNVQTSRKKLFQSFLTLHLSEGFSLVFFGHWHLAIFLFSFKMKATLFQAKVMPCIFWRWCLAILLFSCEKSLWLLGQRQSPIFFNIGV